MDRLLGVDLTNPNGTMDPAFANYLRPATEVMGSGLYTETFAAQVKEALASVTGTEQKTKSTKRTQGQQ
jgi:hypothetical protein